MARAAAARAPVAPDPAGAAAKLPVVMPAVDRPVPEAAQDQVAQAPAAGGPADPARVAVVPAATNKNKTVTFFLLLCLIIKLFCVSRPAAEFRIPFSSTFRPGADLRILSLTKMDRGG